MPIYEIKSDRIEAIPATRFREVGLKEREDLQRLLREQIEVISPDTLVIAEEFGEWEDSRRRIDLLGVDRNANIVVFELKRTEDGGHMELQAIRYAAMVSTLTWERVVEVYGRFLTDHGRDDDPTEKLLEFLDWSEPDEELFAQEVHIVLASAEFSKELTTAVLWLNERDLDIRCVRLRPYRDGDRVLLDVQQVIPLPETEQYQVQLKEKARSERVARMSARDTSRYDVQVGNQKAEALSKRHAAFEIVRGLIDSGATPEQIIEASPVRKLSLFLTLEGRLNGEQVETARAKDPRFAKDHRGHLRWFHDDDELFYFDGQTYALTNQWGRNFDRFVMAMKEAFPEITIKVAANDYR